MSIEHQNQTGHPGQSSQRRHGGFTLVELMVVVSVVGILAVIAAPGMTALLNANRLNAAAGELTTALQVARSEAIRRNNRVWVCPTDGSATGTTVCSNSATWGNWAILDLTKTVAEDRVIRNETSSGTVQISGPAAGIDFRSSGVIDAQTTVTACMPVTQPDQNKRVITVMISGILSTSKATGGGSC